MNALLALFLLVAHLMSPAPRIIDLAPGARGPLVISQSNVIVRGHNTVIVASPEQRAVEITGSNVRLENVTVQGGEYGVLITKQSSNVTVRLVEARRCGAGIGVYGRGVRVEFCTVWDGRMIQSDPGGDNDYGCYGVEVTHAQDVEIRFCFFYRLRQPSHDYGMDGSGVELYGNLRNVRVHDCVFVLCNAGYEAGGGAMQGVRVYNCLASRCTEWDVVHDGAGKFAITGKVTDEGNRVLRKEVLRIATSA
jgi:hypothetical protein